MLVVFSVNASVPPLYKKKVLSTFLEDALSPATYYYNF
jgi:hypothetical protein